MRNISRRKQYAEFTSVGKPLLISRQVFFTATPLETVNDLVDGEIKKRGLGDTCDSFVISNVHSRSNYHGIIIVPELGFDESDRRAYFKLDRYSKTEFYAINYIRGKNKWNMKI